MYIRYLKKKIYYQQVKKTVITTNKKKIDIRYSCNKNEGKRVRELNINFYLGFSMTKNIFEGSFLFQK